MSNKTLEKPTIQNLPEQWQHAPSTNSPYFTIENCQTDEFSEQLVMLNAGRAAIVASEVSLVRNIRDVRVNLSKTVERRRSAHEVGFGMLVLRPNIDGKRDSYPVAFKPFSRPERALHETLGYLTLVDMGVETYSPIGVFPSKVGDHYVAVTKKRSDLISLDRDKWVIGRKVVDEATSEITQRNSQTVSDISRLLGYVHSKGVFHPDGQIKNYAKTPKGNIGIIDTERLIMNGLNHNSAAELAWIDIEKLVNSLLISTLDNSDTDVFGVGMFYGMPLRGVRRSIEDLILVPYLDSLTEQLPSSSADGATHINNLYESVCDRFYKEDTWPAYFIQSSHKY